MRNTKASREWARHAPRILMWAALGLCLLSGIEAARSARPLFNEGAHWFFGILTTGEPFRDVHFRRYADLLPQLPAVLAVNFDAGQMPPWLPLAAFSAAYALQPYFLLLLTLALLSERRRPDLIPPVLASHALYVMLTLPAPQMIVPQALAIFWFAFCLALLHRTDPAGARIDALILAISQLLLALTHETSVVLLAVLAAALASRARRFAGSIAIASNAVLSATCALVLVWAIFGPFRDLTGLFTHAYKSHWSLEARYSVIGTLAFATLVGYRHLRHAFGPAFARWSSRIATATLLASAGAILFRADPPTLQAAKDARVVAASLAAVLALAVLLDERRRESTPQADRRPSIRLAILAALVLFVAAHVDLHLSRTWNQGVARFQELLTRYGTGCHLARPEELRGLAERGLVLDRLPMYGFALLRTRTPDRLVFNAKSASGEDPCHVLISRKQLLMRGEWYVPFPTGNYLVRPGG